MCRLLTRCQNLSNLHMVFSTYTYVLFTQKQIINPCRYLSLGSFIGRKLLSPKGFCFSSCIYPEFRNLFYHRIGGSRYFLNIFCPKLSTLRIGTKKIGPGLFIQHGFSTAIDAESIGKDCWINQQVTIGFDKYGSPTILDNVTVRAGAIVVGKITIGNNVVIGANATVFNNVPDNCTVFAPPSRVMHWSTRNKSKGPN